MDPTDGDTVNTPDQSVASEVPAAEPVTEPIEAVPESGTVEVNAEEAVDETSLPQEVKTEVNEDQKTTELQSVPAEKEKIESTEDLKTAEKIDVSSEHVVESAPKTDEKEKLSNYVRLRGLPFSASDDDVKKFLNGIEVVAIQAVGGRDGRPSGECYIELPSVEEVEKALKFHMEEMENRYVEVFTVTEADMNARRISLNDDGKMIRLRGLPYEATKQDVEDFLKGHDCEEVVFGTMGGGRPSGEVYVRLATKEQASKAMELNRQLMGKRYIEVFRSSSDEMESGRNPGRRDRRDRDRDRDRSRRRDRERDRPSQRPMRGPDRGNENGRSRRGPPPPGYRPYDVPSRSDFGRGHDGGYDDYYGARDPYYGRRDAPGYGAYGGGYGPDPYYDAYQGGYGRGYGDMAYGEGYGAYGGGYDGGYGGAPRGHGGYGGPREAPYGYPENDGREGRNRRSGGGRSGGSGGGNRRGRDSERSLRVYMRGVPYDVDTSEIQEFFSPIPCVSISIGQNAEGRASGDAAVDFGSTQNLDEALKRNKLHMGKRYVELFTSNDLPGPLRRLTWKPLSGAGLSAPAAKPSAAAHPYAYSSESRTGIPSLLDADPYAAAYGSRASEPSAGAYPTAGAYPAAYGRSASGADYSGYPAARPASGYY